MFTWNGKSDVWRQFFSFAYFGHVTHIGEHTPQDICTCTRSSADSKQASTYKFDVHMTVYRDKFLIINQLDTLISLIYFRNETLNVSYSSSAHHQELFSVNTTMVYVIKVWGQLESRIRIELQFHPDHARKLSANLYDIYHCCVYSDKLLMMDRVTVRNM
jgi:hypothetical protein